MDKKYQIFISSTYEDLKDVRAKAIHTILSMSQFPAGMELFSAAEEEQWQIITETIDSSDYYVLIVGRKYGSIIADGPDAGISYTEKEFNYALEKGVPILAFVMDSSASVEGSKIETDPKKLEGLNAFLEKVKTGRMVKFWKNADEFSAQLSQTLYKAMMRGNRPGWVRTTEFNIEESHARILELTERVHMLEKLNADLKLENNRKPDLWVEAKLDYEYKGKNLDIKDNEIYFKVVPVYMKDADQGVNYRDYAGREVYCPAEDVKKFRYLCKNGFVISFHIHNDGNARATGVRIHWSFPDELLVVSLSELQELFEKDTIGFGQNAYENWNQRFFEPEELVADENEDKFISLEELSMNDEIANVLDPSDSNEVVSIYPSEVIFDKEEVRHLDWDTVRGVYVLPTGSGVFEIKVSILCNEMPTPKEQTIKVVVE